MSKLKREGRAHPMPSVRPAEREGRTPLCMDDQYKFCTDTPGHESHPWQQTGARYESLRPVAGAVGGWPGDIASLLT
jgi:hypothetical protein